MTQSNNYCTAYGNIKINENILQIYRVQLLRVKMQKNSFVYILFQALLMTLDQTMTKVMLYNRSKIRSLVS